MLNAKIPHKIPSCSGHSGCCKPVRRSPQNGRGIAAPAAVFDHHRHRKPRLLHRPIPDEHRVCVVGAIRQRARQLGLPVLQARGMGDSRKVRSVWAIWAIPSRMGANTAAPPGAWAKRPAAPARLYSRRHRLCFGQNAAPGAGHPAQGLRHRPPAARG